MDALGMGFLGSMLSIAVAGVATLGAVDEDIPFIRRAVQKTSDAHS